MTQSSIIAIVQARMGSTRLPGKAMLDLAGQPLLVRVIERVQAIRGVDRVVLATTTADRDRPLIDLAQRLGVDAFAGDEDDVLDRYYQAAQHFKANAIVRLTADCPMLDPSVSERVLDRFRCGDVDYVSNTQPPTFPDGLDTEVFSFAALDQAWRKAQLHSEREHVTPYIWKNHDKFRLASVTSDRDLSALRWTVDEARDLEFVRAIYMRLYHAGQPLFGLADVLALLEQEPVLQTINADIARNAGYLKSLNQDSKGYWEMQPLKRSLDQSNALWDRALKTIMDGTQLYSKGPNVSVKGVSPIYLKRGQGSHVWDVDGTEYIDYSMGVGPNVLGYAYPRVNEAIARQLQDGTNFSLVHPLEVECAELIVKHVPCAEMVRFLKTGSDATTAAVRIARAYTGRDKVIKGEYHGWHDWCMANTKRNAGIPKVLHNHVFYMEYNRLDQAKKYFAEHPGEIACVITEPCELDEPQDDFLNKLRDLCHENGALLIFDEVVTGFRFGLSGAQGYFGVTPDMATFGKAVANGMPLSVVAGRAQIMEAVRQKIFISTTFGGETLSLAAACATIHEMEERDVIPHIWHLGQRLRDETNALIEKYQLPVRCVGYPPRINLSFMEKFDQPSLEFKTLFLQEVTKRGVLMGWTMFPSFSHTDADIDKTLEIFDDAFAICRTALREENVSALLEGPLAVAVDVL